MIGEGVEEFPDLLLHFDNHVVREADTLPQGEHLSNKLHELYFAFGMTNVPIWYMSRGLAGLDTLLDGRSHSNIYELLPTQKLHKIEIYFRSTL